LCIKSIPSFLSSPVFSIPFFPAHHCRPVSKRPSFIVASVSFSASCYFVFAIFFFSCSLCFMTFSFSKHFPFLVLSVSCHSIAHTYFQLLFPHLPVSLPLTTIFLSWFSLPLVVFPTILLSSSFCLLSFCLSQPSSLFIIFVFCHSASSNLFPFLFFPVSCRSTSPNFLPVP
jgi:hypothetical protein